MTDFFKILEKMKEFVQKQLSRAEETFQFDSYDKETCDEEEEITILAESDKEDRDSRNQKKDEGTITQPEKCIPNETESEEIIILED